MILDRTRPLFIRLLVLVALVLVPPVAWIANEAMGEFTRGLTPEMDKKAEAIGRDLEQSVERAVGYGIPLDQLQGVGQFFAPVLAANPELRYLAITDRGGKVLFAEGVEPSALQSVYGGADFKADMEHSRKFTLGGFVDLAQPMNIKGTRIGHVHVGMDQDYVRGRVQEILIDLAVVTLVAFLVAVEILLFVVTFNITGPMRVVGIVMDRVRRGDFSASAGVTSDDEVGRFVHGFNSAIRLADQLFRRLEAYVDEVKAAHFDPGVVEKVKDIESRVRFLFRFARNGQTEIVNEHQATDIRLPLFLFVFAEEISRSFMPLYIRDLYAPISGLTPELVMGLPIALFMLVIALASPSASLLANRLGARRVFLIGLVPATIGFVMSGLAFSVYDLIVWRVATALGYAFITMACQGYIAQVSRQQTRAQGLGVYVGAVLTASVCGTGIGGVLAERVGFRVTFIVAAVLTVVTAILIWRLLDSAQPVAEGASPRKRDFLRLLRNWRFSALVVFAAIPAKIALTGFLFFLVPLTLSQYPAIDLGDMARMMMAYPVSVVLLSPLAARFADRVGWRAGLLAVGGLIGGAGLVLPAFWGEPVIAVQVAILMLGISHGLSASPQLAMIPDLCWTECRAIGQTNVLAFLRLAERIGSFAGPLLAAVLIPLYGHQGAIVALGWVVLAMAAVFAVLSFAYHAGPHIEAEWDE
ncbi:MFS transporter [Paramagnetospirillum magneticum]|nr:MFS transporter [Paramagnetospirillum magneticum]